MARVAAAVATLAALTAGGTAPLTMLTDPRARCLDGTLSGFYYQPASNTTAARKWIVSLDGGGECGNKAACYGALNTTLGSSKYFAASRDFSGAGRQALQPFPNQRHPLTLRPCPPRPGVQAPGYRMTTPPATPSLARGTM
jgi:hypothetical protein